MTGWVGWGWFAGIMLIIAGVIDAIYGFIAVFLPSSSYFIVGEGGLVLLDVQGWGWWHVIIGAALILVGIALFSGAGWARDRHRARRHQRCQPALPASGAAVVVADRAHARCARHLRAHRARPGVEGRTVLIGGGRGVMRIAVSTRSA